MFTLYLCISTYIYSKDNTYCRYSWKVLIWNMRTHNDWYELLRSCTCYANIHVLLKFLNRDKLISYTEFFGKITLFTFRPLRGGKFLSRSSHRRCSINKLFLKISQYSKEDTCVGVSSLIKLQVFRTATLLKRDSNTVAFLWKLQNFYKHLFWRTFTNGCLSLSERHLKSSF